MFHCPKLLVYPELTIVGKNKSFLLNDLFLADSQTSFGVTLALGVLITRQLFTQEQQDLTKLLF